MKKPTPKPYKDRIDESALEAASVPIFKDEAMNRQRVTVCKPDESNSVRVRLPAQTAKEGRAVQYTEVKTVR